MLDRLARFVIRRRIAVLVFTGLLLVGGAVFGSGVFGAVRAAGFLDPGAESSEAARLLEERFGQGDPNFVLVATAHNGRVDDPASAAAGQALTARLAAAPGIQFAASYWTLGAPPPLRSEAGDKALVLARIEGGDEAPVKWIEEHRDEYRSDDNALSVRVTGLAAAYEEAGRRIEADLTRAEAIAFPITAVGLVLVFGSAVAAALPLAVGVIAILGTFAVLRALALMTDVSIYSINLTTALGLGLAIDYSLFVVSRFREELRHGHDHHEAVVRTLDTAGRTVLFSALTVAASLAALLVFPMYFLRSFAYAGVAVVLLAALATITALPALLAVLGSGVDSFRVLRRRPAPEAATGFWHRLAVLVMRRPLPIATGVIAVLLLLGTPFLNVMLGASDDRVLPRDADTRVAANVIREEFASQEQATVTVVAPGMPATDARLADYAARLSAVAGAARVDSAVGAYAGGGLLAPAEASPAFARFAHEAGTWLAVVPGVEPRSPDGERLARAVRDVAPPVDVLVGGQSAELVDSKVALLDRLPLAGGIIAVVTLVVLFLMFGSLLVPAKALVLNLLSLTATFGALVWVFQEGHGAGLLGFTATGSIEASMPILMFCIAFGLSMDYEVFLLSRIKERHDEGATTTESVAVGLEQTGRIVTAAAGLLAVVFLAFATSGISFMKMFGLGLTLAVVMDATLVRGALVPAFMRLAGEANWWAPGPIRRFHARFGLSESRPATSQAMPR